MVMQIRRTAVPNNPPTDLAEGQLGVEMADNPPKLWIGVPTDIDSSGRRLLSGSGGAGSADIIGWQLKYVSPTELRIVRCNGGHIKHNGALRLIPAEGIPIPVNGPSISQQSTHPILLCLRDDWSIIGVMQPAPLGYGHRPSTAPGNEGVEVLTYNNVEQSGSTLLGIVQLIGTAPNFRFENSLRRRFVRSWMNPRPVALRGNDLTLNLAISYGEWSGNWTEIWGFVDGTNTLFGGRCEWVQWKDEPVSFNYLLAMNSPSAGQAGWQWPGIGIDQPRLSASGPWTNSSPHALSFHIYAGYRMLRAIQTTVPNLAEGFHDAAPLIASSGSFNLMAPNAGNVEARPRLEGILGG